MSDIFTGIANTVASINPFTPTRHAPLAPNLPQYTKQLTDKYARLNPTLQSFTPAVRNSLIGLDAQRVASGRAPMNDTETAHILSTTSTNTPATPPPTRTLANVPGNFLADLGDMVKSIPRLPLAMAHEVMDLPNISDRIAEAQAQGDNALAATLSAPGIRLVPGAYIAANLARGGKGLKELGTHPLMSALDVLPYASKFAAGTDVGKLAADNAKALGKTSRPLADILSKRINPDTGLLEQNRLGRELTGIKEQSRAGQLLAEGFGFRDVHTNVSEQVSRIAAVRKGLVKDGIPEELAQQTATLYDRHPTLPLHDPAYNDSLFTRIQQGDISAFTPQELAYKSEISEINNKMAKYNASLEDPSAFIHNGEVYNKEQWAPIRKVNEKLRKLTNEHELRVSIEGGAVDAPGTLASMRKLIETPLAQKPLHGTRRSTLEESQIIDRGQLTKAEMGRRLEGHIHSLTTAGYDTRQLIATLKRSRHEGDFTHVYDLLDSPLTRSTRASTDVLMAKLEAWGRTDGEVKAISEALKANNGKRFTSAMNNVRRRNPRAAAAIEEFADPEFIASLRDLRDRNRYLHTLPTARKQAQVATQAQKILAETTPARWMPAAQQEAYRQYKISQGATVEDAARMADRSVRDWQANDPHFDYDAYKLIRTDIMHTWQDLKDRGLDPEFVHVTTPEQARQILNPQVSETPGSITATRTRSHDMSAGVHDVTVAINHQAVEILQRLGSEQVMDFVGRAHGIKEADFAASLHEQALRLADDNPTLGYDRHLEKLMKQTRVKFDPEEFGVNWSSAKLRQLDTDSYWIPKPLAKQLKSMHDPKSFLGGVMDPLTNLFKFAVIGLSPRTQLYNILGGGTMVTGQAGFGAWKYMNDARAMLKDPSLIPNEHLRAMIGSQKRSIMEDRIKALPVAQVDGVMKYLTGRTMRRLMNTIQESKLTKGFKTAADKSLDINGWFDDQYRIMAYLTGRDKGLMKGMTKEAAEAAGMEMTRKTLMDWGSFTPMERSVLKSIFPFYGFMSYAMKYVLRYPVDHPLRAELMARFAQAELADMNDTLPSRFLASLPIGKVDADGHQGFLQMAAVNPFGDVANSMTLAGFLGSTNPILATILESVGMERGSAELYPSLQYDPQSGRLAAEHPNSLMTLLTNTIPQSQILINLFGVNSDFNDQLRRDPAGAMRQMLSAGGLPTVYRSINVPQEQAKAELARMQADQKVKSTALASGNYSDAMNHPHVAAFLQSTNELPEDVRAQYTPQSANAYATYVKQRFQSAGGI